MQWLANAAQGSLNAQNAVENNQNALTRYQNRQRLLGNIADSTDPFSILEPLNAIRAEVDYLNKLKNKKYRDEQDKINENIRNYLLKQGVNIKLKQETVLLQDENGIGRYHHTVRYQ